MQFLLRSRFRGAFLGAALGQIFATIASDFAAADFVDSVDSKEFDFSKQDWGKQAIRQTRELIAPKPSSQPSHFALQPRSAIGFLPLILFSHESPEQLQHSLKPQLEDFSPGQQTEILTIALTVSLMLREQFLPDRVIPLLLEGLLQGGQDDGLANQLQQLQSWLTDLTPLSMLPPVPRSPFISALYSVLKTPASFQLALRHTLRLTANPEAAALVGLFAGTHLSEAGLPIGWRYAIDRYQSKTLQALWGVAAIAELLDLSDQLWAAWSGAFLPQGWQPGASTVTAIPRLVRPR